MEGLRGGVGRRLGEMGLRRAFAGLPCPRMPEAARPDQVLLNASAPLAAARPEWTPAAPPPPAAHRQALPPTAATPCDHADHNARSVAQISLVDEHERVLCNLYVRPDAPITSYLTPLTGLTPALLAQHGMPLAQAVAVLRQFLPPSAVLVGQNIAKDVQWLGLKEGQHFEQVSAGPGGRGLARRRAAQFCAPCHCCSERKIQVPPSSSPSPPGESSVLHGCPAVGSRCSSTNPRSRLLGPPSLLPPLLLR